MKAQGWASEMFNKHVLSPLVSHVNPWNHSPTRIESSSESVWESAQWRPQSGGRGEQRDAGITKQLLSLAKKIPDFEKNE